MNKIKFSNIFIVSFLSFLLLTFIYYQRTHAMAVENAKAKIDDMLLNYKAVRTYVGKVQKVEIYNLQQKGIVSKEYFSPPLLSSTFSATSVNNFYNEFRKRDHQNLITVRFASDNPTNPANKADKKESELLKKFNNKEIKEYSEIINKNNKPTLYYVLPTEPTTKKCMRCHSDPKLAPKGLLAIYGDKNGFHEKVGKIRAILSTTYPLEKDFKNADETFFVLTLITFIIFTGIGVLTYFFTKKLNEANDNLDQKVIIRTKELEEEKEYIEAILDNNPNMIVVLNQDRTMSVNKQFCNFFKCKTMEDFIENYKTISSFIVGFDDKLLPSNKQIEGLFWYEYLANTEKKLQYILIEFENKKSVFLTSAIYFGNQGDILITLQDVTEQTQKDKLLFEQSKLASMGEMIGNIAHQWRQPLSIISTSASGMQLQKEYDMLDDETFYKHCEAINDNAQYLSKTIDDFRDFIKADKEKTKFLFQESVKSFLKLVDGSLKTYYIDVILDIDKNVAFLGYPNEIVQCFMTLYNNSKDALQNKPEKERYIFITIKKEKNQICISFKDSGGGIKPEIQSKIFEPYFTTKHQSQGTGVGLYMVHKMIVDSMGGTIEVDTVQYEYEVKTLLGAEFTIKFLV